MKYTDYLSNIQECPFCRPERERILENSTAFLTYSLAPYHQDHLLILPKRHIEELLEITEQELKDIDDLQKRALNILSKLGYENFSVLVRNGENSGRSVAHLHYNIIPNVILGNVSEGRKDWEVMTDEKILDMRMRLKSVGVEF